MLPSTHIGPANHINQYCVCIPNKYRTERRVSYTYSYSITITIRSFRSKPKKINVIIVMSIFSISMPPAPIERRSNESSVTRAGRRLVVMLPRNYCFAIANYYDTYCVCITTHTQANIHACVLYIKRAHWIISMQHKADSSVQLYAPTEKWDKQNAGDVSAVWRLCTAVC